MERKEVIISPEKIKEQYRYMDLVKDLLGQRMQSVHYAYVETFGCQQNEADSERIMGMLVSMGYTKTTDPTNADIIIVNTCAVREHAELRALSITGQFKHLKEKKRSLIIGVCGCMVSQEHRKEDIKNKYPYINFLFGTSMNYRLPEILYTALIKQKRAYYLDCGDQGNIAEGLPVERESSFKAWVSVMYGCNNFCTYCVVPYVRGRERSRDKGEILSEINDLAKKGYKEITLLGQNVNSYGKDLPEEYDFADLLSDICKIEGDFTVRFMTSHPKDASKKLIDTMAKNDKIAKAFHLPLQSGSDRILKEMNRHYDKKSYLELVSYMRERMPDIAITTDIIVGFPGETEEDFEETLEMLKTVEYDNIYSFIYSKRKGTKASVMECQIPEKVKKERFARMIETQNAISNGKNNIYLDTVQRVLVEGRSKTNPDKLTGRNEKNRLVHFSGPDSLIGCWANIKITEAETFSLSGELIK
ncbi:MAG: tRNA (N6-isopentenyl adenosine(37)-C2)-methylthiotransferase MiaB [Ruminococcaceae bacterium]|nr:tRNA (N6-isopentenyl adenosine(37)-C2)-methylthiotransferase MiaB [Oscillospiraceae bacterium]